MHYNNFGKTRVLKFWVEDRGETIEDAVEFAVSRYTDTEYAASDFAEDYWNNRDGWEATWPVVFSIAEADGTFLGKVSVECEHRPHFNGRLLK